MSTRLSSQEDYKKLLDSYDTWLFDCDGVLWRGDHLIDGATEVLEILRRRSTWTHPQFISGDSASLSGQDKKVVFVTNNATKSRKKYKMKFDQLGVEAHVVSYQQALKCDWTPWIKLCQDEIYGSAYAAAVYLSTIIKIPKNKKVYVIGQNGLEEELRGEGIQYIGGTVMPSQLTVPNFHTLTNHDRTYRTRQITRLSLSTSATSPLTPMSPQ